MTMAWTKSKQGQAVCKCNDPGQMDSRGLCLSAKHVKSAASALQRSETLVGIGMEMDLSTCIRLITYCCHQYNCSWTSEASLVCLRPNIDGWLRVIEAWRPF